jgi:hypothetical protein
MMRQRIICHPQRRCSPGQLLEILPEKLEPDCGEQLATKYFRVNGSKKWPGM